MSAAVPTPTLLFDCPHLPCCRATAPIYPAIVGLPPSTLPLGRLGWVGLGNDALHRVPPSAGTACPSFSVCSAWPAAVQAAHQRARDRRAAGVEQAHGAGGARHLLQAAAAAAVKNHAALTAHACRCICCCALDRVSRRL